jgi:RNA polymerase sigma-70 factor (ECF subfamily)
VQIESAEIVVGWNPEGIMRLYDELHGDLYGFALAVARDGAAAEDLVQESFLRLVREHRAGRAPQDARTWLFRVCTNMLRSRFRRRLVAERHWHLLYADEVGESPEAAVLRSESRVSVRLALAGLHEDARTALMLSAEGFSGPEVARILGRSEGATRTLLWRARAELRRNLGGEIER